MPVYGNAIGCTWKVDWNVIDHMDLRPVKLVNTTSKVSQSLLERADRLFAETMQCSHDVCLKPFVAYISVLYLGSNAVSGCNSCVH